MNKTRCGITLDPMEVRLITTLIRISEKQVNSIIYIIQSLSYNNHIKTGLEYFNNLFFLQIPSEKSTHITTDLPFTIAKRQMTSIAITTIIISVQAMNMSPATLIMVRIMALI